MNDILTQQEVLFLFGITKPTLLKWRKEGNFPAPIKYKRNVFYRKDEVMKRFAFSKPFIEKLKTVK